MLWLLLILPFISSSRVFLMPQSACRVRCANGGACAYESEDPSIHSCICLLDVWEGEFCEIPAASTTAELPREEQRRRHDEHRMRVLEERRKHEQMMQERQRHEEEQRQREEERRRQQETEERLREEERRRDEDRRRMEQEKQLEEERRRNEESTNGQRYDPYYEERLRHEEARRRFDEQKRIAEEALQREREEEQRRAGSGKQEMDDLNEEEHRMMEEERKRKEQEEEEKKKKDEESAVSLDYDGYEDETPAPTEQMVESHDEEFDDAHNEIMHEEDEESTSPTSFTYEVDQSAEPHDYVTSTIHSTTDEEEENKHHDDYWDHTPIQDEEKMEGEPLTQPQQESKENAELDRSIFDEQHEEEMKENSDQVVDGQMEEKEMETRKKDALEYPEDGSDDDWMMAKKLEGSSASSFAMSLVSLLALRIFL